MRKLSLRYGLVFANSGMLLIHFLPDDIKLIPFKCVTVGQLHLALEALRNALYKFKTYLLTYLLDVAFVKPSNCCVERSQTSFRWIVDLQTAAMSTQLIIRCGRLFRNVFTIQTSMALMN